MGLTRLLVAAACVVMAQDAPKEIKPDWKVWETRNKEKKDEIRGMLEMLASMRPDTKFETEEEKEAAYEKVGAAYKTLRAHESEAQAAAAELVRETRDEFTRLICLDRLFSSGKQQFQVAAWGLARADDVDMFIRFYLPYAHTLGLKGSKDTVHASLKMLRLRNASAFLPAHFWTVKPYDILIYTLGIYGPDICKDLVPKLKDRDPYVARNAAVLLSHFCYEPAIPDLLKMLEQGDIRAVGAARALGRLRVKEAFDPVVAMLESEDAFVRHEAAFALYEFGDKEALPPVEKAFERETDPRSKAELRKTREYLKRGAPAFGTGKEPYSQDQLKLILKALEKSHGQLISDEQDLDWTVAARICASADLIELDRIEKIRQASLRKLSDEGNRATWKLSHIYVQLWRRKREKER